MSRDIYLTCKNCKKDGESFHRTPYHALDFQREWSLIQKVIAADVSSFEINFVGNGAYQNYDFMSVHFGHDLWIAEYGELICKINEIEKHFDQFK